MSDERDAEISKRIDREIAGAVALSTHPSGAITLAPKSLAEILEFAKLMSVSGPCIRAAFRGNPGACLALTLQAMKWNMDPFAVANKAYVTKNKAGDEQIAYEAQLIHSIVNTRAPLKGRLRETFTGQSQDRACKIIGYLNGEEQPFEYQSPPIKTIAVKNSPLWAADPDQQLWYYSTRAWARRHVPEILLGIYTPEELKGEIIDMEPARRPGVREAWTEAEVPPRPQPEDFAVKSGEVEEQVEALREAGAKPEPPPTPPRGGKGRKQAQKVSEVAVDPRATESLDEVAKMEPPAPANDTGPGTWFYSDHQGEVHEFADWQEAVASYADMLESSSSPSLLDAAWENGAPLVYSLRQAAHGEPVDALVTLYEEMQEKLRPAVIERAVLVPYVNGSSIQQWFYQARDMLKTLPPGPQFFAEFEQVNAAPLQKLGEEYSSWAKLLRNAIAKGKAGK